MFYVYVNYFYLSGTCYAPEDGALDDPDDHQIYLFDSIKDAISYLEATYGAMFRHSAQTYSVDGRYVLRHGEYACPVYKIRKVRKK